jgi:large conductance mechanosensitive channel
MLKEFKEFIARANIIDLAVAVIIGVAFGKIVTSFVDGIIMPPIGMLLGKVDFASLFLVLDHSKGVPVSLAEAKAKGAPVIAYGTFLNDVVNFLIIALVIFLLVKFVNKLRNTDPSKKDCPYCLTGIPILASRCSACCADLKTAGSLT